MPIGPLGKLGSLVLGAKLTLEEDTHRIRPSYHVGLHRRVPLGPLVGQLLVGQLPVVPSWGNCLH